MEDRTIILLAIPSAIICAVGGFYLETTDFVQSLAIYYVNGPYENVALSLFMPFLLAFAIFRKVAANPKEEINKNVGIALAVGFIGFALFGIYALLFFIVVGFIYFRFVEQNE
jgi:hypothetical protein